MRTFDIISLAMILMVIVSFPDQLKPWMLFIVLFYVIAIALPTRVISDTGKTKAKKSKKGIDPFFIFFVISGIFMILFQKVILLRIGMSVWVIYYFLKSHFILVPQDQIHFIQEAKFISIVYVFLSTGAAYYFLRDTNNHWNDYWWLGDIFFITIYLPSVYVTKTILIIKGYLTYKRVFFNQVYMPVKIVDKPKRGKNGIN